MEMFDISHNNSIQKNNLYEKSLIVKHSSGYLVTMRKKVIVTVAILLL
jgi:hypothetical protein